MNILITGGTGSFGRAFVRDALENNRADRIVVYSRDEWKQAEMAEEFPSFGGKMRYFLGDVRDRDRLKRAMADIDFVVHAAALKRVDAVAYNPSEVVKTNVIGTMNVIDAALDEGVRKVILISSDKAVNPTNIYGASKFMAEQYSIHANSYHGKRDCVISVVRWGNVMGSRGSVVNTFRERAAKGRSLQITNTECTRFFITLPQAVSFTWNVHESMFGGEVCIPRLKAFRIIDLAQVFDDHRGMETVGLRPGGEKIHESLLNEEETIRAWLDIDFFCVLPTYESNQPMRKTFLSRCEIARLERGFKYTSDRATRMTVAELKSALE
ncbi:hypothetical protein LCGC14_2089470, partial [marine sediment metagenome]